MLSWGQDIGTLNDRTAALVRTPLRHHRLIEDHRGSTNWAVDLCREHRISEATYSNGNTISARETAMSDFLPKIKAIFLVAQRPRMWVKPPSR
jgi:hypothetical protein